MVARKQCVRLIAGLVLVVGAHGPVAPAENILVDDFEDGVLSGGGNVAGGEWFVSKSAAALSVVDDSAALGSGLALLGDVGDPPASLNVIATTFDPVDLSQTGDFVRVTFDFRFDGEPSIEPAFTPGFGLFDTNGTPGPGADVTDDDAGYSATISTSPVVEDNNTSLGKEPANSSAGVLAGAESFNFNGMENPEVFLEALRMVRKGGTVIEVGNWVDMGRNVPLDVMKHIASKNMHIHSVFHCGTNWRPVLKVLQQQADRYAFPSLITHRMDLDELVTGFGTVTRFDECVKIEVVPHQG